MSYSKLPVVMPLNFDLAYERTCADCEGTGQHSRLPIACRGCGGSGKVIPECFQDLWDDYQAVLGSVLE